MANLSLKATDENTYDAIVIGSGISGGFAAKELTEKGLKTLVLERGRMVKHVRDYPGMNNDNWDYPFRNKVPQAEIEKDYFKQKRTGYTIRQSSKHWFVKDSQHPYTETKRFDWIRGYHVGGRSLMWGRQVYRWSDLDFEANAKEGIAVDWPIRYADIAPWYSYVEKFVGISGEKLGLAHLPDGEFLPPMELNCVETHLRNKIAENYKERVLTVGRVAHITKQREGDTRGSCQYRNRCIRGCPYGAYFSSNAATLPAAEKTGNMTLRPNSAVSHLIYDKEKKKATGVSIVDSESGKTYEFYAKVIFVCASALGSTQILLNSTSDAHPNGLGNQSGELGHNLMDHHFYAGAKASIEGYEDKYFKGRRPNGIYIPRFRNISPSTKTKSFLRGYGYQGGASRSGWGGMIAEAKFGGEFKDAAMKPGNWGINLMAFGEMLPYHENKVTLNHDLKDKDGLPTLTIDCEFKQNEFEMRKDMQSSAMEMLEKGGFKDIKAYDRPGAPGLGIHEMGTARMGRDPKTSVLNKWNQVHTVPNVYVTDGACMTSSACQNPSITYMALTARACDHAVKELKKGNLK